jgi:hypothetical protein
LSQFELLDLPPASTEETSVLKRNTLWPKQDFVVIPINPGVEEAVLAAIGGSVSRKIIHIQIEKDGCLESGA